MQVHDKLHVNKTNAIVPILIYLINVYNYFRIACSTQNLGAFNIEQQSIDADNAYYKDLINMIIKSTLKDETRMR